MLVATRVGRLGYKNRWPAKPAIDWLKQPQAMKNSSEKYPTIEFMWRRNKISIQSNSLINTISETKNTRLPQSLGERIKFHRIIPDSWWWWYFFLLLHTLCAQDDQIWWNLFRLPVDLRVTPNLWQNSCLKINRLELSSWTPNNDQTVTGINLLYIQRPIFFYQNA